jgi:hypothetical protein
MIVQNVNNETVIRIPNSVKFNYLQNMIDYLSVKSILAKSEARDQEIDQIAEDAQEDWWTKNKRQFLQCD